MTRRAEPPEATWERLRPLLGPVLGLTRVATLTGLDTLGIPVCMAVRPASRVLATTQGKGLSLAAAKVSAVMESAESFAAERYAGPLVWGATAALADRYPLLDTADLPRFHQARPLGPDDPIAWIAGEDLLDGGARRWVPFEMVQTHYAPAGHLGLARFRQTTRGLAAGSTALEAVGHALCELVEGDSNARMVGIADLEPHLIDPDTVDDPACRAVLDACERAGVLAVVIDTTGPLGLAAFQVGLLDRAEDGHRIVPSARGMGCHPSRAIALVRALTEAAQSRVTLIGGAREDLTRAVYTRAQGVEGRAALRELAKRAARRFDAVPTVEHPDGLADTEDVLERLRRAGLRHAVVVDLSPHPAIAVVRVLVPGLLAEPDI